MLKVDLKLMNNVIVGQILEQDENLRGKGKILSDGKVNICSNGAPELNDFNLFIRGELRNNDNDWFCYSYDSADEAKEYYDAFLKAIENINEKDDKLWLPKYGEEYYRIITTGDFAQDKNTNNSKRIFSGNNVFKSREVADKVSKSTKLHWLLWKLKEKYCPDYEFILDGKNFFLKYNHNGSKWEWSWDCYSSKELNIPHFDTTDSVKRAVDYLNTHTELWEDLI